MRLCMALFGEGVYLSLLSVEWHTGDAGVIIADVCWTVPGDSVKETAGFSMKTGKEIDIFFSIDPENEDVRVGISDSAGKRRYITGKDSIAYTFSLDSGTYYVFVENRSSSSMNVEGGVFIYGGTDE